MKIENGQKRFGFVILHYIAYDMTVECVTKLLYNFGEENIKIVIVDNASPNESGEALEARYAADDRVVVLANTSNEGFARGNNRGYDYLVEHDNPDYIVVMNNDVLIEQPDFLIRVDCIYRDTAFAVLGPDIYCPLSNSHQNPAYLKGLTKQQVSRLYWRVTIERYIPTLVCWKNIISHRLHEMHFLPEPVNKTIDRSIPAEGAVLHGACYIFSRNFVEHRKYCFFPGTFLYVEEDILHLECMRSGLKMVYSPEIVVKHMEDVSTKAALKTERQRFKMKRRECARSLKKMLALMEMEEG